ncbi:MAG: hypothetical protein NZV14_04080 [Bryobacteraceae bacterium]|nr:hypothetical protein [Bryobacteraceae bacterium]MDW8377310.1 hypothetical protein [Bryobacterales bacterium]
MRCLYCRRPVSILRQVVDAEFCSSSHRRRYRSTSARALRDSGELADYDDYLAIIQIDEKPPKNGKFSIATAAMIGLVLGLSLWFLPSAPVPLPGSELRYTLTSNPVSQKLRTLFPDTPRINLRQDFRMGLGDWLGGSPSDSLAGALKTDRLRLWKPTLGLSDYQMEFQATIEKRSVGWAFRASDTRNYYAAKIIAGSRDGKRSEIERFVMIAGREMDRVRLPIPVHILPEQLYRIRVRVKGDSFSTSVDGQVIDSWRDRRLRKGGVGFFAEKGEVASVRWVSLSEPDSFFSRLFAADLHAVDPIYGFAPKPAYIPAIVLLPVR